MVNPSRRVIRALLLGSAFGALTACDDSLDFDLRNNFGDSFDTSGSVRQVYAARPVPDARGVLSYPHYQVAVARRGDTINDVAARLGVDAQNLARHNGISENTPLRAGEIIALRGRVAEPSPSTGAIGTGPIRPAGEIDVSTLAGDAINRSDQPDAPRIIGQTNTPTTTAARPQTGDEPVRHKVKRGETAYSISRTYNVTVQSLAEWNGLGTELVVREGQFLLIPVAAANAPVRTAAVAPPTPAPGEGSPTPEPPSASTPLPENDTEPAAEAAAPESPELAEERTEASGGGKLLFPVSGNIIRPYEAGQNSGIDIAASVGSSVKAADSGTVAAITQDTDEVPVLVIRHADNLLTVYANISDISVSKGDSISRGQQVAKVRNGNPAFMRFEVRRGFDAIDPMPLLN